MAANSRSDVASSFPETSFYHSSSFPNGQRTPYTSGSLRETLENRALSSSAIPPIEIPSPSSYLTTVQISLGELKYSRTAELRRVFGIFPEENSLRNIQCKPLIPSAAEELKRFRASVIETASRARERTRMLLDSSTQLEKYLKLISKKRQRTGSPSHQNSSDLINQRHDDRMKIVPPNKRVRSSMGEMRAEGRSTVPPKDKNTIIDKDKNMLRACNGVSVPVVDKMKTFSFNGDASDNKIKKKRTVGTIGNRLTEGDREMKGDVQRLSNEARHRSSIGPASSGISSNDSEASPSADTREQPVTVDKDWNPIKGGNNVRENAPIGGPRPLVKGKSFQGPRSTTSSSMKMSPGFRRTPGFPDAMDQPPILNKAHQINETNKRPLSEWGGQRPLKNTRTRRMNVISPIVNHEDVSSPADGPSQLTVSSNNHQVKLKFGNVTAPSSAREVDGLTVSENKKEKVHSSSGEMEAGVMNGVQKVAALMVPWKKNKTWSSKNNRSDGVQEEVVRRHGGRGRSGISEATDLSKPPVSGKPVSEIRVGRPPLRKATDRKASNQSVGFCDRIDGSYNDHDDLVAAANLARDARCQSCSNPFWKDMDPYFSCISEENLAFLKDQMNFVEEVDLSLCSQNFMGDLFHEKPDPIDEEKWFQGIFPLSQMLLAAFIIEKETEIYYDDHYNANDSFPTREDELCHYEHDCLDDQILMELRSISLFPDPASGLAVEEEIDEDLQELKMQLYEQIRTRKCLLRQLIKAVEADREAEERRLEQTAMDKLVELAYKKCQRGRGGHGSSHKSGMNRVSRQMAQAFALRVLTKCQQFEATGLSCFSDTTFRARLSLNGSDSKSVDAAHLSEPSSNMRAQKVQEPQASGSIHSKPDRDSPAGEPAMSLPVSIMPPPRSTAFSGSTKGKRRERDRDHPHSNPNRQAQTTTTTSTITPQNNNHHNNSSKNNNNSKPSMQNTIKSKEKEEEPADLIHLQLDSIDGLGEPAQDLGTWLSLDDDNIQDDDLMMGLEIPMDDLSELNMSMNF